MYPFMTLMDNTEITHSEMFPDGKVKVYIETPDEKIAGFQEITEATAHLIMEFSLVLER